MEICNRYTKDPIYSADAESMRELVERAVSTGADLSGANLSRAKLTRSKITRTALNRADLTQIALLRELMDML